MGKRTVSAISLVVQQMLRLESWGRWPSPCPGACPVIRCVRSSRRRTGICELTYEKQIDFSTVDLKKLKVKDLKKILSDWDEGCDGCLEKGDLIKRIEELKPKHVRTEL